MIVRCGGDIGYQGNECYPTSGGYRILEGHQGLPVVVQFLGDAAHATQSCGGRNRGDIEKHGRVLNPADRTNEQNNHSACLKSTHVFHGEQPGRCSTMLNKLSSTAYVTNSSTLGNY